jgi:hypothetical protein
MMEGQTEKDGSPRNYQENFPLAPTTRSADLGVVPTDILRHDRDLHSSYPDTKSVEGYGMASEASI